MSTLLAHKSIRIKKNTHGSHVSKDGLVSPVDVLIDRNQQWKHITKSLLHYYQGLSAIESTTAKSTSALTETIQVPFHEGNVFMGEGGWQEVLYEVRDKTKIIADHHQALSMTLDETVVKELEGVRSELKAHILAIEKEAGVLATEVAKERAASATALTTLQNGIDVFENSSEHMLPQHDPYITHTQAVTQLDKQLLKENDLQASLIRFQQQQPSFEANIAKSIQSAAGLFDEAKAHKEAEIAAVEAEIVLALQRVTPDAEYKYFAAQPDSVLDPNTPFRSIDAVTFPGQHHASTIPIKEGILERKKRFTKSYKESYYVLSPSGFLHERKSNDDINAIVPKFSLFLPECSLGAPAKPSDKSHKFHVEGNKAIKSSIEGKMKNALRFGGKEIAYTFRARTHAEMMGWWDEMDKLSRDTKTENPTATRGKAVAITPVAAAVANVGYAEPVAEATPTTTPLTTETTSSPSEELHSETTSTFASAGNGLAPALGSTTATTPHEYAPQEEESEDEEGGSSAEEEYETQTAPTTPAVNGQATSPLDFEHVDKATSAAEVLPIYHGEGNTTAEHEAATTEKKGGLFSAIFGGGGSPSHASTSS